MHDCTDRIIEKRLISGFEYSNYRKETWVNLAWVRFTSNAVALGSRIRNVLC